jgi:short-subunit dehydrogenase
VISTTLAGEIGLIERSGYCASKFAATGFFEALRMEVGTQIDITILCPPSVVVKGNVDSEIIIHQREMSIDGENTLISNRVRRIIPLIMDC